MLALLTGRPAAELLDTQRAEHLRPCASSPGASRAATSPTSSICDHALFHLEADLRWLELTAARLDALRGEVAA